MTDNNTREKHVRTIGTNIGQALREASREQGVSLPGGNRKRQVTNGRQSGKSAATRNRRPGGPNVPKKLNAANPNPGPSPEARKIAASIAATIAAAPKK